jgi:thiamine pyrophosphate-dependent acetolactate synthase large subunit-like protein
MTARADIVRAAIALAVEGGRTLFVGNGFLSRDVMSALGPGEAPVLPIQGGMGLAGGVAAGYLLARPEPGAVVLEGDGNHLMGWGCAQFVGSLSLNLIHIVSLNESFASVGGWRVPRPLRRKQVTAAAEVLGYRYAMSATDSDELDVALSKARQLTGPILVYVDESASDVVSPRRPSSTAEYADRLAAEVR